MTFPNPLIPGFNPDPSVILADGAYYLVTSTFEYLPGIPVYRSSDLITWTQIGNVATRPEQAGLDGVATGGGVWAPTIRYRDGVFYVIVTIAMSPRGCVVFTATDPAGPWSDGITIEGVGGIDPDLAWDEDGTSYVTFSGLSTSGEQVGQHLGIQQVRVDLAAGKALEAPRSLWSGTGLKFPEAPHLYQRGDSWYLLIAEGGTERGHGVSVARAPSPEGPFEGHPANPVLSARSTSRPIQNTGHADLIATPDGGTALVLLGVRPLGLTQSFSPLGRETFITPVSWAGGWPQPAPVRLAPRDATVEEVFEFTDQSSLDEPGWLAIRTTPESVASIVAGRLSITGRAGLDDPHPQFVGRRQRHLTATVSVTVDGSGGTGGLAARYDEDHWICLEARGTVVTARAHVAGLAQSWQATIPAGDVELRMEMSPPPRAGFTAAAMGGDRIRLLAAGTLVAELDGRYWTAETCTSFTGRVIGLYASQGTVSFAGFPVPGHRGMTDGIGFGAAYYTEYQRRPDIEADFSLMAKAGFSVIRVGESVWSTWEPQDGRFELDWLEPVLDAALRHDIKVILGTPTYAVPMWLTRRYPEIAAETVTGHRVGWGARQEVNFAHAAYRLHAERVIRQVVGRYRDHPAITGYQVDNEPGLRLLYNADVFEKFVDWLRRRYGTVSRLNEEWGLAYWSHRLSRWSDLWRPEGNFQPQYDLAWRRFQAELVTEFIGWQAGIVRELTGGRGFVTTCISYEQPGIEDAELSRALDVASGNAYCEMQDSLAHPNALPRSAGPMGWVVRGPWAVTQLADLMYSSKQAPFLITETNAGSIGFSSMNESPYDGQWRQLAWLLVARGARLIEYWHWNTLPFGAETYWGGVLPHSGIPGRAYQEIARTGQELREAGGAFGTAEPDYDIAVLYDSDSKFALSTQGPLRGDALADPDSYRHIVAAFSRGIFDAKRQQRLVRPQHLLPSRGGEHDAARAAALYPVLIAAAFYTATDEDLDFLVDYAQAGGHLVVGPRTGYGDEEGRARTERAPARITDAAGVWYDEMASLPSPVPAVGSLPGAATGFAEGLVASDAEVLAGYQHPHLSRWAAVTTKAAGAGRITVVGTVPDQTLAAGLVRWLAPRGVDGWTTGDSVTVSTCTDATGTRLHVLHNWGWEEAAASPSSTLTDELGGGRHTPGVPVTLGPWDVRLFRDAKSAMNG